MNPDKTPGLLSAGTKLDPWESPNRLGAEGWAEWGLWAS